MKTWKFLLAALAVPVFAHAQEERVLYQASGLLTTLSSDQTGCVVELKTGKVTLKFDAQRKGYTVETDLGVAALDAGAPAVPKVPYSLQVPGDAGAVMQLVAADSVMVDNIDLLPGLGNTYRNQGRPAQANKSKAYSKDAYYPGYTEAPRPVHQIRGVFGQAFWVYPVQYNPIKKQLKIYTQMKWVVTYSKAFENANPLGNEPREWQELLQHRWLNAGSVAAQTATVSLPEEGSLLVFTKATHLNTLQPFVRWKQQCGRKVIVVNIDTLSGGAGASDVRTYIAQHYLPLNVVYVLLVGDNDEVPALQEAWLGGPSDAGYGMVAGVDHYPDLMVGRFSCNSEADLQTQVTRSMLYEKEPSLLPGSFNNAMGIASEEGPGDNNELDWEHMRHIRVVLQGYGYAGVAELYDGSQGGADAAGNPTATDVINALNSGAGLLNYIGHGNALAFQTSGFTVNHVPQLRNTGGAWPFAISVACSTGDFMSQTCLGEALVRSQYNNQPTGAVGAYMSSILQSWDPPMKAQDDMMNALAIQGAAGNARSLGGLTTDGCIGMNDAYGNDGAEMTDTWILFGDPSLRLRTRKPDTFIVQHTAQVPFNTTQLTVQVNQPGRVTLFYKDSILSVADAVGGQSVHSFAPLTAFDSLTVTVTAPEFKPYQGKVVVGTAIGIDEVHPAALCNVYPNPVRDMLYLSGLQEPASVRLYSVTGQLVKEARVLPNRAQFNVGMLPAGVYHIVVAPDHAPAFALRAVVKL